MAAKLQEIIGQTVVFENRPGANGAIGAAAVAKAVPDGTTLMATFDSHSTIPALLDKPPLNIETDLVPVMLVGETGTGKELVARVIHRYSAQAERPFATLNCGDFQPEWLECELFGHEPEALPGEPEPAAGPAAEAPVPAPELALDPAAEDKSEDTPKPEKADVRIIVATNAVLLKRVDRDLIAIGSAPGEGTTVTIRLPGVSRGPAFRHRGRGRRPHRRPS